MVQQETHSHDKWQALKWALTLRGITSKGKICHTVWISLSGPTAGLPAEVRQKMSICHIWWRARSWPAPASGGQEPDMEHIADGGCWPEPTGTVKGLQSTMSPPKRPGHDTFQYCVANKSKTLL